MAPAPCTCCSPIALALLGANAAAGVLVRPSENHGVERATAPNTHTAELESYQSQFHTGPCVQSIESGQIVVAAGTSPGVFRLLADVLGRAMSAAGSVSVHALPGCAGTRPCSSAMNLFWRTKTSLAPDDVRLAPAFADILHAGAGAGPRRRRPPPQWHGRRASAAESRRRYRACQRACWPTPTTWRWTRRSRGWCRSRPGSSRNHSRRWQPTS